MHALHAFFSAVIGKEKKERKKNGLRQMRIF